MTEALKLLAPDPADANARRGGGKPPAKGAPSRASGAREPDGSSPDRVEVESAFAHCDPIAAPDDPTKPGHDVVPAALVGESADESTSTAESGAPVPVSDELALSRTWTKVEEASDPCGLDRIHQQLQASRDLIAQEIRAVGNDPMRGGRLWEVLQPIRDQVAELIQASTPRPWVEYQRGRGAKLDGSGAFCKRCSGTGWTAGNTTN